jgi:hypothetical protein
VTTLDRPWGATGGDESIAALELDRYIDGLLATRDEAVASRRRRLERPPMAPEAGQGDAARGDRSGSAAAKGVERAAADRLMAERAAADRLAADRLAATLVRVHPSFRFEERLAQRLAALAAAGTPAPSPAAQISPDALARSAPAGEGSPAADWSPTVEAAPVEAARAAVGPPAATPAPATATSPPAVVASPAAHRPAVGRRIPPSVPLRHPLVIGGAITSAAISIAGVALFAWRRSRPRHPMARAVRLAHGALGVAGTLAERRGSPARRRGGRGPALLAGLALRAAERAGSPVAASLERPEPRAG